MATKKAPAPRTVDEPEEGQEDPQEAPETVPATTEPPPDPPASEGFCNNCGEPAIWRTIGAGAEPSLYCDACGRAVYPEPANYLVRLDSNFENTPSMATSDLERLTKEELEILAAQVEIQGRSSMTKAELITALQENYGQPAE